MALSNTASPLSSTWERPNDLPEKLHQSSAPDVNERRAVINIATPRSPNDQTILPALDAESVRLDTVSMRQVVRKIRAKVPQKEYETMLEERQALVLKEFREGLTHREGLRLQMLRWQIEGIEDARFGPQLDQLEVQVEMQEQFGATLHNFLNQVQNVMSPTEQWRTRQSSRRKRGK